MSVISLTRLHNGFVTLFDSVIYINHDIYSMADSVHCYALLSIRGPQAAEDFKLKADDTCITFPV